MEHRASKPTKTIDFGGGGGIFSEIARLPGSGGKGQRENLVVTIEKEAALER